ncbi:T9SS type A sorting domain-containing protein [Aequorivita antarctica]|uniref:T9SS type A sorting domain-containing protein n=1 Tax=Aequorivita antarctica TaxID=153266 RepID=A0A5C6YVI5_9FLAO|nr:T9SS type A sorting domain-containing protein [Aequorivita antarctica]TXD71613.1 T9SS type A sorting domain-containing protein [Aequorivita antarctica]
MKKITLLFYCFFIANTAHSQDFGNAATDVYVMEYFTNPGQFGTIPLAGPYYPIPNVITNNAFTMLGGDFNASGTLYTVVYQNPDYILGTVDLSTGAVNYAATITGVHAPEFLSQLSYNVTNDTFYALSHDPNNSTGTQFYSLNVTTGQLTEIGTGTGIGNGVAMEIDNNGVVYAADANNGNLYTIDINTGVGTVVGNMNPNGFYPVGQGFSIDKSTNTMYAVLTNSNGLIRSAFYTVNVTTGALTLLGDGSSRQYSLFVIADQTLGVADVNLDSFKVYPNPASNKINIENPQRLLLKNVKLFDMLGRDTGSVFANDEINIENLAKGMYILQLETENGTTTKKIVKK